MVINVFDLPCGEVSYGYRLDNVLGLRYLEDRVITSTWLDNTTDYIVNNQRNKFKEELDEQQAIVQSLDISKTNGSSNNIMDDSMNSFEDDFMNEVNEQRGTTSVTSTSTTAMTSSDTTSTTRGSSTYTPLSHLNTQTIINNARIFVQPTKTCATGQYSG